ncbi:tetratricopeptide repeat protein [Phycicoccus sp. MAQZ13P-2]|uniref:tetratricopeptide repeat protein n=1 Tax=Phycicoccus mangrovi TaxID=2840470 RepID=UPI001C0080A3|nr:tetratricopeptide repeat protein [Phycicoccus mangrovi]MBT9254202.1 tetratricopeptide repeat protein [Phycicoccus mangrovi]MBT9272580.1 tetratricopeptide repeat protein [Phycicoccus mangrovi]
MTQTPDPAGARGAVDLSAVAAMTTPGAATAGPGAPAGPVPGQPAPVAPAVPDGLVVEVTPATLQQALTRTVNVAGLLVLWSSGHPQTRQLIDTVAAVAARQEGRVLVLTADLTGHPELLQAFQPLLVQAFGQPTVPATFGLLQGQPVPLFPGIADEGQVGQAVEQLLQAAVQNGITGRVDLGPLPEGAEAEEEALSPLHEAAYEAIERGDLAAAAQAYEQAIAADASDDDARLGLAQVRLMERTQGVDLNAARAAAAADPSDVEAACVVADLDVLGGHVEDAFTRLVDLVRTSAGEERDRARTHLLGLFDVVGAQDERVRKGRTALMSALF